MCGSGGDLPSLFVVWGSAVTWDGVREAEGLSRGGRAPGPYKHNKRASGTLEGRDWSV